MSEVQIGYKRSESYSGDPAAINEGRGITTSKRECDDIINIKIKINSEYANLLPELTIEEYESLKESIKQHGLWVPLIVNQDGMILDGHHRYKICQQLGIEPHYKVREFRNELDEKLFVIDCNLKRRHLNKFLRIKLALKSKSIREEIARKNSQSNLKQNCSSASVRNLTVGSSNGTGTASAIGRVDEQIGKMAGVSRDTVRKVEKILQYEQEKGEIMHKLTSDEMSINQAYESISKSEGIKKQQQKGQYTTTQSAISNNIIAGSSITTMSAAKPTSDSLKIKEGNKFVRSTEKSNEAEDLAKQNYEMKQEIQALRDRINCLEQISQRQEEQEEWTDTKFIVILGRNIPIKVTVNSVKREIVYMELDVQRFKSKIREDRAQQRQKQQKEI